MKKFFAFAIAIVAMATSMVSCNNDNADFVEQKAPTNTTVEKENPQEMMDISLVVAVTKQQQKYLYDSYIIQTPGRIQTVMVSEMDPASQEQINTFLAAQRLIPADLKDDIEYYSYKLGKVNSYDDAKVLSHNLEAKLNHPTDDFSYVNISCFIIGGQEIRTKLIEQCSKERPGTDESINGLIEIYNQDLK